MIVAVSKCLESKEIRAGQPEINAWLRQFKQVLSPQKINALCHEVGWCQRERQITPWRLALSLLVGFTTQRIDSLADAQRLCNALFGPALAYKPFHKQLAKARFADFMRELAGRLLHRWLVRVLQAQPDGAFAEFEHIVIQDGNSFKIKQDLAASFPGRFKQCGPAAVELHTTPDLYTGSPSRITLTPDTFAERAYLPEPDKLANSLLLVDRGYFQRGYLAALDTAGAHFVVRATASTNPHISAAFNGQGKPRPDLCGRPLQATRLPKRGVVDLDVCWGHGSNVVVARFVISGNAGKCQFLILATNLVRARYRAFQVKQAYQLRWQVELLFKEYKSYANLHAFDTANPAIAEGLIWAAIAAATLKRVMAHVTQRPHAVEVSSQRVAICADPVLLDLFKPLAADRSRRVTQTFTAALAYLAENATQSSVSRPTVGAITNGARARRNGGLSTYL